MLYSLRLLIWTEPALADLDAIADYGALDNAAAAAAMVRRVMAHVRQLATHPESGSRPRELGRATRYRQIIELPCRIFYRVAGERVLILHVMRCEQRVRARRLV